MDCTRFLELLDGYIDGELTAQDRDALLAHARSCPACAEELEKAEFLKEELLHLNDDLAVPLEVQAGWRRAIRAEVKHKKRSLIYSVASTVAAVFVLMVGTTMVFRETGMLDKPVIDGVSRAVPYAVLEADGGEEAAGAEANAAADNARAIAAVPETASIARSVDADMFMTASAAPDSVSSEPAAYTAAAVQTTAAPPARVVREMTAVDFDATLEEVTALLSEYNAAGEDMTVDREGDFAQAKMRISVSVQDAQAFLQALDFVGDVLISDEPVLSGADTVVVELTLTEDVGQLSSDAEVLSEQPKNSFFRDMGASLKIIAPYALGAIAAIAVFAGAMLVLRKYGFKRHH